jgi:hypothetical protein
MGLGLRLLDDVVSNSWGLGLRGDGCCPHSSANFCRLGLNGLIGPLMVISTSSDKAGSVSWRASFDSGDDLRLVQRDVSTGSGANLRFVLVVVSMGCGANLRFVLAVISTGCGANLRFVLAVVSTGSGANLRLVLVEVSTGSGANLLVGLGFTTTSSTGRSLEDITDVSMGSILNRLGGTIVNKLVEKCDTSSIFSKIFV